MVTDMESLGFSIVTELTELAAGPQPPESLDVRRPDNYRLDDATTPAARVEAPTREASPRTRPPAEEPAPEQATPTAPPKNLAPSFSFTPEGGSPVSNDTQAGRVTVLYFWGTWCIPCRAVSPKVSELAERFADQPVDVFAPAIRERDPEAPRSYIAEQGYKHRLVLGAGAAATAFKVRIYPTVVVIGPDNAIVYEAFPTKERTPETLASEVADAIEAALASARG
jgi:thiol-disulfide isomerase/thioredoxin